jgi:hypothetical protein
MTIDNDAEATEGVHIGARRIVAADTGPFILFSRQISFQGSTWTGYAYVSPKAIYFIFVTPHHQGTDALAAAFMSAVEANAAAPVVRSCSVADLPNALLSELAGAEKLRAAPVVIIPREAVSHFQIQRFNNFCFVFAHGERFGLATRAFGNGTLSVTADRFGYPLKQRVMPVSGDTAPAFSVVQPALRRTWLERALALILFLALLVVIVLLKLWLSPSR